MIMIIPLLLCLPFYQAKKETVDRVCDIVKKQLALPEGTEVCGSSKFQDLGADSLDTVSAFKFATPEFIYLIFE
jgi:hypothetical protein|uniref:Carrier domain-containing protein n=1 Tax=Zea mays TaxID=4577 RepID=B4FWF4_MAIZE|nr:unknown [Zea mays]